PSIAYTDPEIAWAGVTEREASEKHLEIEKAVFPWSASGRSLTMGRKEGKTKMIFDKASSRVIGAGIVGSNASELISEMALSIEMGCTAEDLSMTIHPHPTLSESITFAAEIFEGSITDLYLPKKKTKTTP
ncbi:MAG: dihydrolipoyl dehydrogenase, partial [Deltaproteobacteria bacterium]|nr:dihydrolipoyl dehydrogenase [Deltaproteobacteria bacterium]